MDQNRVSSLSLPRDASLTEQRDEQTGDVSLHAPALAESADPVRLYSNTPPTSTPVELTAVPYATWGNRGQSAMTVWIRESATGQG